MRSRAGGPYGESMPRGQQNAGASSVDGNPATEVGEGELAPSGRTRQSVPRNGVAVKARSGTHIEGYNALDEMEDESDASSSGAEWDGGDDDDVDDHIVDEEDEEDADMSDDEASIADEEAAVAAKEIRPRSSLVIALRYHKTDDAPITPTNTSEQSPKAKVSNAQQLSLASRLASSSGMTGSQSRAEEVSNEKQNDLDSIIPTELIKSPSIHNRPNQEHVSGPQLVLIEATNQ